MAAWAVKNTSPMSRGNQSMIGMGAGAVSSLPGASGVLYGLGGALGVASGGAQVIGGIAATFTGAGAAVGIPMILKGAVEVVVSVQVLSAAVEGEENKAGREAEEDEENAEAERARKAGEPRTNHRTVEGETSLPPKGEPNSSADLLNPDGSVRQRRYYGPDGKAQTDIDYNHSDNGTHEFPHTHEWDWGQNPPRQK